MEKYSHSTLENELRTLREGIRKKYKEYQATDRDRFPDIEYNTNRANYEPLKDSFEEEFYVVRSIDRAENNLHIPSTKTLALIFSEDSYMPGKKILNTCLSYMEGKPKVVISAIPPSTTQPKTAKTVTTRILSGAVIVVLVGFTIYAIINQLRSPSPPGGLVIHRPYQRQIVPRQPFVTGKVSNADTVWIVVRPVGWDRYYVQPPIVVKSDGTWRGQIYVGSAAKENIGLTFQIRAFVNPAEVFKVIEEYEKDVFTSWPNAQLSTDVVEVVRGLEAK